MRAAMRRGGGDLWRARGSLDDGMRKREIEEVAVVVLVVVAHGNAWIYVRSGWVRRGSF